MMNFCTYFDSYYLVKGLSLYYSLEQVTNDFHLYVMAFDKECYDKLNELNLECLTVELLDDFETPELLAVKPTRTKGEYCWTCGPSVIYHFLTKFNLSSITYLDSDLMFMSNPSIIAEEVGGASVAITEQGLGENEAKSYGKYCVQYLTFRNDENGLGALTWWRDSCIEWCFQKMEKTRYADQKYLDQFPIRWKNVHVIKNIGVGIAPWNMHKYIYKDNHVIMGEQISECVFFHMHGVQIELEGSTLHVSSSHFELSDIVIDKFYKPYSLIIKSVLEKYLNYKVDNYVVHDLSLYTKIKYRIKKQFRNNRIVQWIWFVLLKKKGSKGHGTKF
jgi:hypothetical protein